MEAVTWSGVIGSVREGFEMKKPGREVSPPVAARILECHVDTVYRWIVEGRIVSARQTAARRWLLSADEVRRLAVRDRK